MSKTNLLTRLLHDEFGATTIEYGMILAMIVIAMMASLRGFANESQRFWTGVSEKTEAAVAAS
jgi:pilus assembly protein Flp/PilA